MEKQHKLSNEIISHEDVIFTLAVACGKGVQNLDMNALIQSSTKLANIITDEDVEKSKALIRKVFNECGCDTCKKMLEQVNLLDAQGEEQQDTTGESFAV